MKKALRTWCAGLLALCMAMVMLPMAASAAPLSGTMNIDGETGLSLASNQSDDGWNWDADTATLTLDGTYGHAPIRIDCGEDDTVDLVYSGDVSLTAGSANTIYCAGNLNISENGSGGTLTLTNTVSRDKFALYTSGTLTIDSGTISISGTAGNNAAVFAVGGITIGESAAVTVANSNDMGIESYEDIWLGGSLTATGELAAIDCDSLFVTSGTLTTTAESDFSGDVYASVIVSGGTADIAGDISGSLTVTAGTVTVTGEVNDAVTVLGGTVSVDGSPVPVTSSPTLVLDASETGPNPFHLAAVTGPAADISGYSWDGQSGTLTLSGFTYESEVPVGLSIINGDAEIVLASGTENSITSNYSGNDYTYGISHEENLTISGSGSLTTTGGTNTGSGYSCGFSSYNGTLAVNSGNVTAIGRTAGYSCGVSVRNVTVNGGSLTATGGQTTGSGNTLSAGFYLPYGKVTFGGGSITAKGNKYAFSCDDPIQMNASSYIWWASTEASDPGGEGTSGAVAAFDGSVVTYDSAVTYLFIKLSAENVAPPPSPVPITNTGDEEGEKESAPVTTVKDGNATATATVSGNYGSETSNKTIVAKSDINNAISAAVEAAKKNNAAPKVEIKLDTTKKAEQVQASLPVSSLKKAVRDGIKSFALNTGIASIAFDNDALKGLSGQAADSSLRISVAKVNTDTLTDEVKTKIGGAAVYEFTIMDGLKPISDFGGGKATVTIPYTLKAGESADGVVVWYIGSDGTLTKVEGAKYDAAAKTVTFETTHFSAYAVAYDPAAAEPSAESASPAVSGGSSEAIPATGDSFAFGAVLLLVTVSLGAGITLKKAR